MAISQLANKPNPNTQSPKVFEKATTDFINTDLPKFIDEANATADDISTKHSDVISKANSANSAKTIAVNAQIEAENARNDAVSARNDAVSAKDEIEGYVIPSDATYSPDTIKAIADMAETLNLTGAI